MLRCSKALLDTNAHQHVFKENLFLDEYPRDQSPAIKKWKCSHITSTSTLIHRNRFWDHKKNWILQLTIIWMEMLESEGRVVSKTHPVCDSPNKHSCCWPIASRHQSSLNTVVKYSKFPTELKTHTNKCSSVNLSCVILRPDNSIDNHINYIQLSYESQLRILQYVLFNGIILEISLFFPVNMYSICLRSWWRPKQS